MSIIHVSITLSILVAITGFFLYSRIPGSLRLLIPLAFASGLMEIIGMLTSKAGESNHGYFNVYFLVEFGLMLFALKDLIGRHFYRLAIVESGICIVSYLLEWHYNGFDYFLRHTFIACMAMSAVNNLISVMRTANRPNARAIGIYLITVSSLLYYSSVIPRFGLHKSLGDISLHINAVMNNIAVAADILRFVGIAAGFLYLAKAAGRSGKASPAMRELTTMYGRK